MSNTTHTSSAFDAFYAKGGATPGNAARLAAEDHKSQGLKNWAFIDALREAGRLSDAAPELLEALSEMERLATSELWNAGVMKPEFGRAIKAARAAIAKATA